MTETLSSKQSFSKCVRKLTPDMGALRDPYSIIPSQSKDFVSELSIKSSRVSLYLLGIAKISNSASTSLTTSLSTCLQRIVIIRYWYKTGVSTHIFPRQVYLPIKQIFCYGNIVYQPFTHHTYLFEPIAQTEWRFFLIGDLNYPITSARSVITISNMGYITL